MQLLTPVVLVCNEEYWLPYVLEASRGHFERYVIYDIGSTDQTPKIIEWFRDTSPGVEVIVSLLPMCPPVVQGKFRNSMIPETGSPYYLILDGDEIYTPEGYGRLYTAAESMHVMHKKKLYGMVRRQEWTADLTKAYGQNRVTPHHRIYDRRAFFKGTHPGERPCPEISNSNEQWFQSIVCHHFHHPARSTKDAEVPGRLARKDNATYHRGEALPADLLEALPILRKPIESFPVNPVLAEMQREAGRCSSRGFEGISCVEWQKRCHKVDGCGENCCCKYQDKVDSDRAKLTELAKSLLCASA